MSSHSAARRQMLAGVPVTERRCKLAGVNTTVLEGGEGLPLILLHGGIECGGAYWAPVISQLAESHRVIVPDLPGLGESEPIARGDLLQRLLIYGAPGIGRYRIPLGLRVVAVRFGLRPTERNAERFDRWAFFDFDQARRREQAWLEAFSAYTRARAPVPHVKRAAAFLGALGTAGRRAALTAETEER